LTSSAADAKGAYSNKEVLCRAPQLAATFHTLANNCRLTNNLLLFKRNQHRRFLEKPFAEKTANCTSDENAPRGFVRCANEQRT
jgi:hypothetical protein